MDKEMYVIVDSENFYEGMVGDLVTEYEKAILLEIGMGKSFGGKHRVIFYKYQLEKYES